MKKIIAEYKAFAVKGNVMDMAVGIVVGGAFATITSSLVTNVVAPLLGLVTSGVDLADLFLVLKQGSAGGPYITLAEANRDGAVTLSYGLFLNSFFSFVIVSWIAFFFVKGLNRIRETEVKKDQIVTQDCPFCYSKIHRHALRCPQCTSVLDSDNATAERMPTPAEQ